MLPHLSHRRRSDLQHISNKGAYSNRRRNGATRKESTNAKAYQRGLGRPPAPTLRRTPSTTAKQIHTAPMPSAVDTDPRRKRAAGHPAGTRWSPSSSTTPDPRRRQEPSHRGRPHMAPAEPAHYVNGHRPAATQSGHKPPPAPLVAPLPQPQSQPDLAGGRSACRHQRALTSKPPHLTWAPVHRRTAEQRDAAAPLAPRQPSAPARGAVPRPPRDRARGSRAPLPPTSARICPTALRGDGGGGRPEGKGGRWRGRVAPRRSRERPGGGRGKKPPK